MNLSILSGNFTVVSELKNWVGNAGHGFCVHSLSCIPKEAALKLRFTFEPGASSTCALSARARPLGWHVGRVLGLAIPLAVPCGQHLGGRACSPDLSLGERKKDVASRFACFPNWNEWKWDWTEVSDHKIILNVHWELARSAVWKQNSFHLSTPLPFFLSLSFFLHLLCG